MKLNDQGFIRGRASLGYTPRQTDTKQIANTDRRMNFKFSLRDRDRRVVASPEGRVRNRPLRVQRRRVRLPHPAIVAQDNRGLSRSAVYALRRNVDGDRRVGQRQQSKHPLARVSRPCSPYPPYRSFFLQIHPFSHLPVLLPTPDQLPLSSRILSSFAPHRLRDDDR